MDKQLKNLQRKIETIKEFIYTKVQILEDIRYCVGEFKDVEKHGFDDRNWESFSIGKLWGGRDLLCWFRIPFSVPEEFKDKKIAIIIQPGKRFYFKSSEGGDLREYELTVFLDGELIQSVDIRRNEIPVWDKVTAGENHLLAIEAFSGLESHQHKFEQADLVVLHEEVEDFYYNTKMIFDTILAIGEKHIETPRLFRILEQTLLQVDFLHIGQSEFFMSITKANNNIRQEFYSELSQVQRHPAVISVGHAHLDIAWKWQIKHSQKKVARTFANALRMMDLYPEYCFIQGQPQLYKYVQEYYTSLFNRVKEKIKTGQWEATGGMWIEADCNIPGGESLVRQFLFGKRYFRKEFGIDDKVVWLPDSFGFCYSLPQIIKKSGMRYFMTTKLSWNQFVKFPYDTFYWEGLDGTRILAHFITTPDPRGWNDYSVDLNPKTVKSCWDNYHQQQENQKVLLSFGWGDGGGGPTREMLENAKRINYMKVLPYQQHGKVENFFSELEHNVDQLPVWNDELYLQLHRGCYTSQARIKKNNRHCEILYHNAELFSVLNFLETSQYPQHELNCGWELLLLNQFHDILPGSSIAEVYKDSEHDYEKVTTIGQNTLDEALKQICIKLSSKGDNKKLVIFNPLSWKRSDLVFLPLKNDLKHFDIINSQGDKVVFQVLGDWEAVLFHSEETPSMGYQVFELRDNKLNESFPSSMNVSPHRIENRFFNIKLDSQGQITSIYDKRYQREIIETGKSGNLLQLFEDRPLANDAWDIDISYQDKCLGLTELKEIKVIEKGPIRGGLFLKRIFLSSTINQYIYIYDKLPRIDFKTEINWQQHQTLLKVAFPVAIHANKATYEIPFGNIARPSHWNTAWDLAKFEVPAQKWADLSEGNYGISLLNDCKYGYDIKDNVMRLTLLKSAIDPDPNADIGHHSFCYALYPHEDDWRCGHTVQMAYEFNYPLLPRIIRSKKKDISSAKFSFVNVNRENVIIETLKKAEDSNKIILRVYEAYNERGEIEIKFSYPLKAVEECNLIETDEKPIDFNEDSFRFYIKPYEIKTFLIGFNV